MPKIKLNQHEVIGVFITIVGWLAAFIPAMGTDKQNIIAAGSTVIGAAFVIVGLAVRLADSHVSLALVIADLKGTVEKMLEQLVEQQKPATRRAPKQTAAVSAAEEAAHPAVAAPVDPPAAA